MAHTCPDCYATCYCNGDIGDIDFGEDAHCMHFLKCQHEDDEDYEEDDEDYEEDYDDYEEDYDDA